MLYFDFDGKLIGYKFVLNEEQRKVFEESQKYFFEKSWLGWYEEHKNESDSIKDEKRNRYYKKHINVNFKMYDKRYDGITYEVHGWENPISSLVYSVIMNMDFDGKENHIKNGLALNLNDYLTDEKLRQFSTFMINNSSNPQRKKDAEDMHPEIIRLIELFSNVTLVAATTPISVDKIKDLIKKAEKTKDENIKKVADDYRKKLAIAQDNTRIYPSLRRYNYNECFGVEKDNQKAIV